MPDLIWFEYELYVDDRQESSGDEPRFEFFFINIFNNVARATVVDTGVVEVNMRSIGAGNDSSIGNLRLHPPLAPSAANPYLAFVVRAFEHDDTTAEQRYQSQDGVMQQIEELYNPLLRAGTRPSVNDVWSLVNDASIPTWGDPDEKTGVSIREYPSFGREVARDGVRRTVAPARRADDAFAFSRAGARWRMPFFFSHQFLAE